MIELKGVTKSFGSKQVLKNIHLRFIRGQTHVLLGSSGCGKSTLLRILMGLLKPDSGEARVEGEIGYVIQEGGLFPHLTAEENVALVAKTRRWPKERLRSRFQELSTLVGLESALFQRYPKELSGGQRQRVGLMRALMLDPPLLLLDEPLGALDPIVRAFLQDELKRIFNQVHKTVVIVTHDVGEAAFFGHTITLLREGEVVQHGTFGDLCRKPADPFVTRFLNAQKPIPELKELL